MKLRNIKWKGIFCLFLLNVILSCGGGSSSVIEKTNGDNNGKIRDSFFEVHLEPLNANEDMFNVLLEFVDSAAQYNIKLTLLFTPQWVEMILSDADKIDLLSQWRENGHEVGGHHHGPGVCPWDGYTNLDVNSQEFKNRQNNVPCPESVREQEEYLGDMDDYMNLLSNLGSIKTVTMSDADVDWPEGAVYSAGGRRLIEAISEPELVIYNGLEVYKLSSAPLKSEETVLEELITVDDLKNEYLSEKEGKFGLNSHAADYKQNPDLYKEWFEFLNKQDPGMDHAGTISRIVEESSKSTEEP
ncbi:MAG TPA: hypothetical protein ENH52_04860 [Nitrospirae bacterium]|nr:hypothetical protein [Nitrospirota bacterium]